MDDAARQWRMTAAALERLGATEAFRRFAERWNAGVPGDPMTPQRAYGGMVDENGWESATALRAALCSNHGGGVPIEVIDALVACCDPAYED